MTPSKFQQDIFDFIANESGSLVIDAAAGSGKSTTIKMAAKELRPGGLYKFLAFSKSIAEELKIGMPYFVVVSTFHSACLDALKKMFPRVRIDAAKTKQLAKDNELLSDKDFWRVFPYVDKLVSFAKGSTENPMNVDFGAIVDHHDLDDPPEDSFEIAGELLKLSLADTSRVDFDDMLWLTYQLNVPFKSLADMIFVDEAQDLSGIQHELLTRMLKPNGRLIAVGDPNQAIYGFRGAHVDGMKKLAEMFSAKELPLSVSYRCSHAVVKEAQRILGQNSAATEPRITIN
jgi:superfamily I DNA/RNA helicase